MGGVEGEREGGRGRGEGETEVGGEGEKERERVGERVGKREREQCLPFAHNARKSKAGA